VISSFAWLLYIGLPQPEKDHSMAKAAAKKTAAKTKAKTPARKPVKAAPAKTAKAVKAPAPKKPAAKKPAVVKKPAAAKAPAPARAPAVSKDELRAQLEKLNNTITTLRAKNRDAVKALKVAESRIAELEHEISQIDVKPVAVKPAAPRKPRAVKPAPAPAEAEIVEEAVAELPEPQEELDDGFGDEVIPGGAE
jgi:signal recognition particle GTPase